MILIRGVAISAKKKGKKSIIKTHSWKRLLFTWKFGQEKLILHKIRVYINKNRQIGELATARSLIRLTLYKNSQIFTKIAKLANWRPPDRQSGRHCSKIANLGVVRWFVTKICEFASPTSKISKMSVELGKSYIVPKRPAEWEKITNYTFLRVLTHCGSWGKGVIVRIFKLVVLYILQVEDFENGNENIYPF